MLLSVLCRHVAIRARGRIIWGEVRNLIVSAKKHSLKKTLGPQSTEIHWQWYPLLEDIGHSPWCFWPPLLACAGYGHARILSIFFPPSPGAFEMIQFLNIYVSFIKSLTFLTAAEIQRGLFPYL